MSFSQEETLMLLWSLGVVTYAAFTWAITDQVIEGWLEKRAEQRERERETGEYVCLERIMVDISMAAVVVLFPFVILIEWMFCRKPKS